MKQVGPCRSPGDLPINELAAATRGFSQGEVCRTSSSAAQGSTSFILALLLVRPPISKVFARRLAVNLCRRAERACVAVHKETLLHRGMSGQDRVPAGVISLAVSSSCLSASGIRTHTTRTVAAAPSSNPLGLLKRALSPPFNLPQLPHPSLEPRRGAPCQAPHRHHLVVSSASFGISSQATITPRPDGFAVALAHPPRPAITPAHMAPRRSHPSHPEEKRVPHVVVPVLPFVFCCCFHACAISSNLDIFAADSSSAGKT